MDKQEIVRILNVVKDIETDFVAAKRLIRELITKLEVNPLYTKEMHKRGELPPVGLKFRQWNQNVILAAISHDKTSLIVEILDGHNGIVRYCSMNDVEFFKTQEEKDIEELTLMLSKNEGSSYPEIAKAVIDAGYSKNTTLEEGEE